MEEKTIEIESVNIPCVKRLYDLAFQHRFSKMKAPVSGVHFQNVLCLPKVIFASEYLEQGINKFSGALHQDTTSQKAVT